jgi:MtrB/PioB family decaheme-associated outer membrane protein
LGPIGQGALAADADLPVKAPVVVAETPWWTHGFIEFGGRGFLNDPPYGGHIWQGHQGSLAKYYEYSTVKPGPFGDFYVATGSADGLNEIDLWGKNVGYSDERYDAYWSKAGQQYLDFEWDQTPHIYSTSASTLYNTSGNALTLANPNLPGLLYNAGPVGFKETTNAALASKAAAMGPIINSNLNPTNIGIRRDTASVDYRFTPTDNWDIKANYSNMRRTGSQVDSVLFTATNAGSRVDVPKPVADTTQNFGVNGEYIGVSPWGQRFNAMVGYVGSVYTDDFSNYTVQNPFCFNPGGGAVTSANCTTVGAPAGPLAMMSTPPSNNMNGGTGTIGMDLPLNSRYMGTVTYTGMQQNQQFLPFSINPTVNGSGLPTNLLTGPATSLSSLPAQSLNGQINTLLVNNVLTTQINPNLKTKLSYRYYDYDNQTSQITVRDWALTDALAVSSNPSYTRYAPTNPLMVGYIRQNGAAEVTWRPVNSVNIGSSYNFEHYDFTKFDASSTSENTGKVYADWKPVQWVTVRTSANYGERRASNYDYLGNVGNFQWFGTLPAVSNGSNYSEYYRQFYLDDRNRTQARFQIDVDVLRNLTVTPTVKWSDDEFLLTQNQLGLTHDRSLGAGVEASYVANSDLRFLFSYMNENRSQFTWSSNTQLFPYSTSNPQPTAYTCGAAPGSCQLYGANIDDRVNTFIFGVNYAVIPSRFELGLNYTVSYAKNSSPLFFQNGTGPVVTNFSGTNIPSTPANFPDVTTNFQRLEANAKYVVDPELTRARGIPGQISLRLRYAWERNSVTNWNNDLSQPYLYNVLNQSQTVFYQGMAWNNPNYNVHMLAGSLSWAW